MKHISKILDSIISPVDVEQMGCHVVRAGDILRLVTLIVQPFREANPPLQLDEDVQDDILPKLCAKLEDSAVLLSDHSHELDGSQMTSSIFFLARLLQFVLTMTIVWSPQAKRTGNMLTSVLTRLVLVSNCVNEVCNSNS